MPILIRGKAFGNLYLTDKRGGERFTDADEEAGVVLAQWAALDEIGVEAAIQGLAERVSATAGLAVETELSLASVRAERGGPGSELESTIYRLVQEALTNVAKHSRAEHVRLSVLERNGTIELCVEDDGVGFDPGVRHGGFGLLGMRERVAMVGGRFELTSAPGAGATMRAVIPAS